MLSLSPVSGYPTVMDEGEGKRALPATRHAAKRGHLAAAVLLALAAAVLAFGLQRRDAFWLDESWTGAIVAQPTWRAMQQ